MTTRTGPGSTCGSPDRGEVGVGLGVLVGEGASVGEVASAGGVEGSGLGAGAEGESVDGALTSAVGVGEQAANNTSPAPAMTAPHLGISTCEP